MKFQVDVDDKAFMWYLSKTRVSSIAQFKLMMKNAIAATTMIPSYSIQVTEIRKEDGKEKRSSGSNR